MIQTNSLGRLQKKSLGHNNCLYEASVLQRRVRTLPKDYLFSAKLLSYKLSKCYSSAFKKLHIFFMTRSMTFFMSAVFVISRVVFFLIKRQSSEDVL